MDNSTQQSEVNGGTPLAEPTGSALRKLAAVELPIAVTPLCAIADGLIAKYGKTVTMRQAGTHLVFEMPNMKAEAPK